MLIVQKYGGTSVSSVERIKAVAARVVRTAKKGNRVVVVVSAMSGQTDEFLKLASEITPNAEERELDLLLSSGERISASLTALAIQAQGLKSMSLTGRQVGIITNAAHTRAKIERISGTRIKDTVNRGIIPVIAGFQGTTEDAEVTTLGRGGSDLTAVAVSAALGADMCEIYTDVDGVYTTDPGIVPEARKLDKVSYEEMLEFASLGAKVLQTRSVEFAKKYGVQMVVRSSFNENPGTLVLKEDKDMEKVVVSCIASDKNQVRISLLGVPDRPGIAAKLFNKIAGDNIVVDMIVQNISSDGKEADISFTVSKTDSKKALSLAERVGDALGARTIEIKDNISKISVIGVGMRTHFGVAAKMFDTLSNHNINITMISTSEIKVSCVIDRKFTELAVRTLHDAFGLAKERRAPAKKKTVKKKK